MDASREAGIPAIRLRTDRNESALEWNKMREAVVSMYESHNPGTPNDVALRLYGFRPIARVDGDSPGVGVTDGSLMFMESSAINTAAGDRNEAVEVVPSLGTIALDVDPPPRTYLDGGDHEVWVVWRELGDEDHEARIEFGDEGGGPGSLDRDEKAQRLATFTVNYPGGIDAEDEQPTVQIKKQLIRDSLNVWTERHQFKVRRVEDDKVSVDKGYLIFLKGLSDPLVSESVEFVGSAEITVGSNGSIWVKSNYYVTRQSHSENGSIDFDCYRNDELSTPIVEFRDSLNRPNRGTNDLDLMTSGTVWFEIATVELDGGDAYVTDQIVNGPIYVNEIVDAKLS